MPSSAWKGYISFGLISVPIRLYAAARYSHIAFHEIHRKCGNRVRQQLYCPYDEEVVSRDEIAMGYEVDRDKYIRVEPSELKELQPASSTVMEILQFLKLTDVDPIYFETSYFAVPEEAGERAYALLLKSMIELGYAAIAKITMHQKERTVILRPYQNGLLAHTIYYANEIHEVKGYGEWSTKSLSRQEIDLAMQFAKALLEPFRPAQFHDTYSQRVEQLIDSKRKGKAAPKLERPPKLASVVDLSEALRRSLAGGKKTARAARARKLKRTA